MEVTFYMYF